MAEKLLLLAQVKYGFALVGAAVVGPDVVKSVLNSGIDAVLTYVKGDVGLESVIAYITLHTKFKLILSTPKTEFIIGIAAIEPQEGPLAKSLFPVGADDAVAPLHIRIELCTWAVKTEGIIAQVAAY